MSEFNADDIDREDDDGEHMAQIYGSNIESSAYQHFSSRDQSQRHFQE
jgi:hypothetical protein